LHDYLLGLHNTAKTVIMRKQVAQEMSLDGEVRKLMAKSIQRRGTRP
jgi:hypothetical protein